MLEVKTARKLCCFYVIFSDHMTVLEVFQFGGSYELTLNEGRINVHLDRRKESSC